jgi:hypothetical protein
MERARDMTALELVEMIQKFFMQQNTGAISYACRILEKVDVSTVSKDGFTTPRTHIPVSTEKAFTKKTLEIIDSLPNSPQSGKRLFTQEEALILLREITSDSARIDEIADMIEGRKEPDGQDPFDMDVIARKFDGDAKIVFMLRRLAEKAARNEDRARLGIDRCGRKIKRRGA